MGNTVGLAWQLYRQQQAQPSEHFMRLTQGLLLVFIVTLSLTSHSIQQYLAGNLQQLLGADLVLSHSHPLTQPQQTALAQLSSQRVHTQTLNTTLTHQQRWQRAQLKAVGADYPLQGELVSTDTLGGKGQKRSLGPEAGEIWLGARLLTALQLKQGDNLTLAGQPLRVSQILLHEPDRLLQSHSVAMRALINQADLTRLNLPPDSMAHRTLVTASSAQIRSILDWQRQHLPAATVHHKQGAHPLALFWQRSENVIGLASIVLFFMAAIAIQQLSQRQQRQGQYQAAVCLSLGANQTTVLQLSVCKWLFGWLHTLPLAWGVAAICHWLLIHWLGNTLPDLSNNHTSWPSLLRVGLQATGAMLVLLMVFQLPLWLALARSRVSHLLSRRSRPTATWFSYVCSLLVLLAISLAYSDNLRLTLMLLVSFALCIALLLALSWLGLSAGEKLTRRVSGLLPFALYMMKQRLLSKTTQVLGVGLCAFLLLFTLMLLKDLGQSLSAYQRQHDGNLLVSQATEAQMHALRRWADKHQMQVRQHKPYVYAKLLRINGQMLADTQRKPSDSLATLQRAVRLHYTEKLPANNRLVAGSWWDKDEQNWQQVSVEQEIMTDLGLQLGDTLSLYIGKQTLDFHIRASHVYQPGQGAITFWLQMPASALAHIQAPRYSMASLELSEAQFTLLAELWRQHPSLRMQPLQELTARFDAMLALVTRIISGFALLISMLAILVIVSSVHSLEAREKHKNSIVISFGFSRRTCLALNIIEWLLTATIAAAGAIIATYVAGLLIYQAQFSLNYQPDALWLLTTLFITLVLVTGLGVVASKNSLNSSVRQLLAD